MSIQALAWAYQQPITEPLRKFLLVTLANYADEQGYSYPSVRKLSSDTGMASRSVQYHTKALCEAGILTKQPRTRENRSQTSNGYQIVALADPYATPAPPASVAPHVPALVAPPEPSVKKIRATTTDSLRSSVVVAVAPKKRNDLWDALAEVWGAPLPDTPMHGKFVKATALYRAAGITPDQIGRVHDLYKSTRDSAYTIMAVANNAQELLAEYARPVPKPIKSTAMRALINISDEELERARDQGLQRRNGRTPFLPSAPRELGSGGDSQGEHVHEAAG